ncbi:MAG TPA: helix-turn-helix domain-containing protein [Propionibacteriaceae bacterium]|jgi:AcrR family transcriptional regulator|nr:helix-turn-helix domain-containing protein [Propionibacteriaceae bacterium]
MTEVLDKPLTARRAQTQERLMAAAVRVFAERGIIGASVEEICEAAGFTRGAFYSNFADKDELVLALIRQTIRTQVSAAEQAIARMKAAPNKLDAADLVGFTLTAFTESGSGSRETLLTERELLLYAARQPALRAPYLAFRDECERQLSALISDALAYAGLEFTVPFQEGLALLTATWQHEQMDALFDARTERELMHTLLMAITRPVG